MVSIKDCHALVDGTYPFEIEDTDSTTYVKPTTKNYKWKNGDFSITTKAPALEVLKSDNSEALKHNRNAMYMYWDEDGLEMAVCILPVQLKMLVL